MSPDDAAPASANCGDWLRRSIAFRYFSPVPHIRAVLCLLAAASFAACNRGPRISTPLPGERPLTAYATQRVVLVPVASARFDTLGWVTQLGGAAAAARRLDSAIVSRLSERGVGLRWILPAELWRAYERNRNYATDPYQLTVTALRSPTFVAASRYAEPLASQLRTMIALHEDTRVVLVPVEVRFERVGPAAAGGGRAILRATLLDARLTEARWVADVQGDSSSTPVRALDSVAARLADLFLAP